MNILALDLSLASTGVCFPNGTSVRWTPKLKGVERLDWFSQQLAVLFTLEGLEADVALIEGYSFNSTNHRAERIGELGGVVRLRLHRLGVPVVEVPPANLKRYAAGKGNATKSDMRMALFQRTGVDEPDDNCVDAAWLRLMGLDAYGVAEVRMPETHRSALKKVEWPVLAHYDPA